MTQLAADNFTTGGRGSPNAWSPASDGNNWTVDTGAATLSVVSSQGKTTGVTALTLIHLASSPTSIDFDVVARVKFDTTNFTAVGVMARQTATNTCYRARISSNGNTFGIVKTIAGTTTNLSIPSFTPSLNTEYWIRFKGVGSTLFAMVWQDGSAVPNTWFATATDTSITTAGNVGVVVNTSNSADIALFDNFYATDYATYEIQQLSSFAGDTTTSESYSYTTTITEQLTSFAANMSAQLGERTITEQLTSFSTLASASGAIAFPSTPGISAFVGGVPHAQQIKILEGTLEIDDSISQMSTARLTIRDDTGLNHYFPGAQLTLSDHLHGLLFTGVLGPAEEENVQPNDLILSSVDAQDNHYFAQKRLYNGPEYTNQYAGAIAADLLNVLTEEGITAQYVSRRETTEAQFALGTLSHVVAADNAGDGNFELAPSGTNVTYSESTTSDFSSGTLTGVTAANNTLTPTSTNAIKIQAVMSLPGLSTAYTFVKIWSGSQAVGDNFIIYDINIDPSSPEGKIAIDLGFSDGTFWRNIYVYSDVQAQPPGPTTDLVGLASGQWYRRLFYVGNLSAKTITSVSIACAGTKPGTYTGWIKNIKLVTPSPSSTVATFFGGTLQLSPPQQLQNIGYSSTVVSVVPTYQTGGIFNTDGTPLTGTTCARNAPTLSLDAVNLLKNTYISWTADLPANTYILFKYSLDNQASYVTCTNNAPLPYLPAGLNLTGMSIIFQAQFYLGQGANPEMCPTLHAWSVNFATSYVATKSDVLYSVVASSDWNAGTYSNTANLSGNDLTLNGYVRNFDDGSNANQTLYQTNAQQSCNNRQFVLNVTASTEARSRLDFAGSSWQNFTAEIDIKVDVDQRGLVYRTTGWQNANNTLAYTAHLTTTQVQLGRGTNTGSGAGAFTSIATAAVSLTAGDWHRMRLVVSGNSHIIYLDDVQIISATDSTYTAAGYLGIRCNNTTGSAASAFFDNFGVVAALSGTWVSPSTSIAAAGSYGNSVISWRDLSIVYLGGSNTSVLVEASVNGGSYQACTNGAVIPGFTAGQSLTSATLQLRVTLTSSVASALAAIDNLTARILGAFNSSGTRITPALSLLNVGVHLGDSVVAWNALLPTNTTLAVATSIDNGGSWQTVTNGDPITGLIAQTYAFLDTFDSEFSTEAYALRVFGAPIGLDAALYFASAQIGGTNATWVWDTANSRLTASGGTDALLLYAFLHYADVDVATVISSSDADGLVWRYQDPSNFYDLKVNDASASGNANTVQLYKVVGGTRSQIGSNATISFTRGTLHIARVVMVGAGITVYFDENIMLTASDASLTSAGYAGMRSTGSASFYVFRAQGLGQDVTTVSALAKFTLTSTNPTATPQVIDTTLAAYGNTIGNGVLIPQTDYQFKYLSENFDDLTKKSSSATGDQWWWNIDKSKIFSLLPRTGVLAPWVGTSLGGGTFLQDLKITNNADLYRNRQIIKNVVATLAVDRSIAGDNVTRNWNFGYGWASAPTIYVNGTLARVKKKGETGADFYYAVGDATIVQDDAASVYISAQTLRFTGTLQYTTYSQYDDLDAQAALQLLEGGSGIVEMVEDGNGMSKEAGDQLAEARVKQYSVRGRVLTATTRRYGLAPGQLLPVWIDNHGVLDGLFLIRNVKSTFTSEYSSAQGAVIQQGWYQIEATEGADTGSWLKLYER